MTKYADNLDDLGITYPDIDVSRYPYHNQYPPLLEWGDLDELSPSKGNSLEEEGSHLKPDRGPIGLDKLTQYAVATVFRRYAKPWNNKKLATCKICGLSLPSGTGTCVLVVGSALKPSRCARCYLCRECYTMIDGYGTADGRIDLMGGVPSWEARKQLQKEMLEHPERFDIEPEPEPTPEQMAEMLYRNPLNPYHVEKPHPKRNILTLFKAPEKAENTKAAKEVL